ncbi:cupin domain-containing protein [Acinetobacter oleivorans]|uniref:cupin domain-containing protein n=1 Tax=Acinetobacter oleivorans TaxID=1148157 RepID=UPI0020C6660D|nr:cupin domain-containing protein [Acinetobacter oleivorans]
MEMIKKRFFLGLGLMLACIALSMAHEPVEKVKPNFEHVIPNIPGKSLIALEVDYPPGGASIPHNHAKSSFIYAYVVEGSIESKVNNEKSKIYQAGQSWFEEPGAVHSISRNVSKTKPAKLLAVFVVDTDDKELVTPVK